MVCDFLADWAGKLGGRVTKEPSLGVHRERPSRLLLLGGLELVCCDQFDRFHFTNQFTVLFSRSINWRASFCS